MKVGVVMPTFNQEKWLAIALGSYFSQTGGVESGLVVVDDASTDGTKRILALHQPKLQVVTHEKNRGSAEAINTGIRHLGGEYDALTWISSDNTMSPEWLSVLTEVMEEQGAGAVYSGFYYVVHGKRQTYLFREHTRDGLLNDVNCYYGPAFLIRRDVWEEAGPHRGRISHDYDHWLRVEEVCYGHGYPIVGVNQSLCSYNAHDDRVTVTRRHEFDATHWQAEGRKRRRETAI